MKKIIALLVLAAWSDAAFAQATKAKTKTPSAKASAKKTTATKPKIAKQNPCPSLVVDIDAGTINELTPEATMDEIKQTLPCFTGETPEGSDFNCGGGVFYLSKDVFFYINLDAIEIRKKYTGKFVKGGEEVRLLGIGKEALYELMGEPDEDSETDGDNMVNIYTTSSGSIRVVVANGKVAEVSLHAQEPDMIEVCE